MSCHQQSLSGHARNPARSVTGVAPRRAEAQRPSSRPEACAWGPRRRARPREPEGFLAGKQNCSLSQLHEHFGIETGVQRFEIAVRVGGDMSLANRVVRGVVRVAVNPPRKSMVFGGRTPHSTRLRKPFTCPLLRSLKSIGSGSKVLRPGVPGILTASPSHIMMPP